MMEEPLNLGEGVNSDSETCLPASLAGASFLPRPLCQSWHSFSRSSSPVTGENSPTTTALEQGHRGLRASREFTGHSFCSRDHMAGTPKIFGKAQRSLWFLPCELGNSHIGAAFLLLRLGNDSGQPGDIPFGTSYTRQPPKFHLVPAHFLAPFSTP